VIVLSGPHKGVTFRLSQFCNDWISGDGPSGDGEVFVPTEVRLTEPDEFTAFENRDPREVGTFWGEWRLKDDGTFTAIQARPPRRVRRGRT
jgi:hypothetical protein